MAEAVGFVMAGPNGASTQIIRLLRLSKDENQYLEEFIARSTTLRFPHSEQTALTAEQSETIERVLLARGLGAIQDNKFYVSNQVITFVTSRLFAPVKLSLSKRVDAHRQVDLFFFMTPGRENAVAYGQTIPGVFQYELIPTAQVPIIALRLLHREADDGSAPTTETFRLAETVVQEAVIKKDARQLQQLGLPDLLAYRLVIGYPQLIVRIQLFGEMTLDVPVIPATSGIWVLNRKAEPPHEIEISSHSTEYVLELLGDIFSQAAEKSVTASN